MVAGLGVGLATLSLGGCNLTLPRGPAADFFVKDYDLPPYQPDYAEFHRERWRVVPSDTSGVLGGLAGAVAGGRLRAWQAAASGGLGGAAGAAVGEALSRSERLRPLPEQYPVLALALPIIATDPNKGPTVGLLPVVIMREGPRITNILAPDITWNEIDGAGGQFRMRRFFSTDASLVVDAGSTAEGAADYDVIFAQRRVGPRENLFYRGRFWYSTTLANRFFGIGNETEEDGESTYVFRRTTAEATLGLELPLDFAVELTERIVSYKVGSGRLDDVPSTRSVYPGVLGVRDRRLTVLTHRIRFTYDTRDSRTAPSEGFFAEFIYDIGDDTLGSDIGFQRFSGSATLLIPKFDKRLITVVHFAASYLDGREVPFYELSSIGGKNTLRGFGEGRFVAQHAFVANIEERWNMIDFELMGVRQIFQVAGFIDVGRVYERDESLTLEDLHYAVGAAVRLVVPDSDLVTSIDVGFSDEGSAVFVGLGYPF